MIWSKKKSGKGASSILVIDHGGEYDGGVRSCCLLHIGIAVGAVNVKGAVCGKDGRDKNPLALKLLTLPSLRPQLLFWITGLVVTMCHVRTVQLPL